MAAWPDCEVGKWYRQTQPSRKGRVGECIGTHETEFGHKYAKLRFIVGGEVEYETSRTKLLVEAEGPEGA